MQRAKPPLFRIRLSTLGAGLLTAALAGGCEVGDGVTAERRDAGLAVDVAEDVVAPPVDTAPTEDVRGPETQDPTPGEGTGGTSWLLAETDRPVLVVHPLPDTPRPSPLLILLHGYGGSAALQDAYLGVTREAAARGWTVLLPDGNRDPSGNLFWNAAPSWCCDFFDATPDDTAWLRDLLDVALASLDVDPARVALLGHSNGAYMGHRLACEDAARVGALVAIAGGLPQRMAACAPNRPVSLLQIHGTFDSVVLYYGRPGLYPSSPVVASRWASYNGCDGAGPVEDPVRRGYDAAVLGDETVVSLYPTCGAGGRVELWTLHGSGHTPIFRPRFMPDVFTWLEQALR